MGLTEEIYMHDADEGRRPLRNRSDDSGGAFWDILSILTLVGILALGVVFGLIFLNPFIGFNPYPPPAAVPTLFIPTGTPTQKVLPSIWTPTATLAPTETATAEPPTATITATATDTPIPTDTPVASAYPYQPRGDPAVLAGSVIHPDEGCKLWVAGQAFDMKGAPVIGLTVQLGGYLDKQIYLLSLTGTALQYGPGGYEFTLAEQAVASHESVWVQLLDQEGYPVSARMYFDTFAECDKNLVLVNFKQVR